MKKIIYKTVNLLLLVLILFFGSKISAQSSISSYEKLKNISTTDKQAVYENVKALPPDSLFKFLELSQKDNDTSILISAGFEIIDRLKSDIDVDLNYQLNRMVINDDYLGILYSILGATYRQIRVENLTDIFNTTSKYFSESSLQNFYNKPLKTRLIILSTNNLVSSYLNGYNLIDKNEIYAYCTALQSIMLNENLEPQIRRAAIRGIKYNNYKEATNSLLTLLTDHSIINNEPLVRPICLALAYFKETKAIPLIMPIIENTTNEYIYASAAIALGDIGGNGSLKILVEQENKFEGKYSGVAIRRLKEEIKNILTNSMNEMLPYAIKASKHFYKEEDVAQFNSLLKNVLINTGDKSLIKLVLETYKQRIFNKEEAKEIITIIPYDDFYGNEWNYFNNYYNSVELEVNESNKLDEIIGSTSNKNGNMTRQEYGDPGYQDNSFQWWIIGYGWMGHPGIYSGMNADHVKKQIAVWPNDDDPFTSSVQERPWSEMTDDFPYWGTYNLNNRILTFQDRKDIVNTALDLIANNPIGYPDFDLFPDCLNPIGDPGSYIAADEIDKLRCDGVVEYCYEWNNIWVWGKNGTHYDISNADYVDEHNLCYHDQVLQNPCIRLSPIVQCGEDEPWIYPNGDCSYLTQDAVIDLPAISVSFVQNGTEIILFISVTDVSGIHYIKYTDGGVNWYSSPIQPQEPLSSTYTYVDTVTITTAPVVNLAIEGMDNGGNFMIIPYPLIVLLSPTWLTATANSSAFNTVTWENVNNETGYEIYRAFSSGGTYTQIGTTGTDQITYTDNEVIPNTQYCYKVKAINAGGNSPFSPSECVTTLDLLPQIDLNLEAWNFGTQLIGECTSEYTFSIINTGGGVATGVIELQEVVKGQKEKGIVDFEITEGSGSYSLAANESQEIKVRFCPQSLGLLEANIAVIGSNPPGSSMILLSGTGVDEWQQIYVDIALFLEGPYSDLQMDPYPDVADFPLNQPFNIQPWNYDGDESIASLPNPDIVDWVLVELRDAPGDASSATEMIRAARKAAFLLSDGSIVDLDGISSLEFNDNIDNNLYVIVWHRNHLAIMSSIPLTESDETYTYDFYSGMEKAYGGDKAQTPLGDNYFGMIGGDGNADGSVKINDYDSIWIINSGNQGYKNIDYNIDNQIDNKDKNDILLKNLGTESQVPGATFSCGDSIIDIRNEQKYKTVQIGEFCWMANNLNIGVTIDGSTDQLQNDIIEKYCYNDIDDSCNIYGGLYQWNEAMQYDTIAGSQGLCPDGWHLPTDSEWKIMEGTVDNQYGVGDPIWDITSWRGLDAGGNLKEAGTTHWTSHNSGATNIFGFLALGGGYRHHSSSVFYHLKDRGHFWSSTQQGTEAWQRGLFYNLVQVYRTSCLKNYGLSVRCLKDPDSPIEVYNPATGRIWMGRNLGASQVATGSGDTLAFGDLYQWGRLTDGHEDRYSGTTTTLSPTDVPGHDDMIITSAAPNDWRNPQNDNLWQGVTGINNPCPEGFRIPTEEEWDAESQSWSSFDYVGAFNSPLKLPRAGRRNVNTGALMYEGAYGYYWCSTVDGTSSKWLHFGPSIGYIGSADRATPYSVRCIKEE